MELNLKFNHFKINIIVSLNSLPFWKGTVSDSNSEPENTVLIIS